LVKVRTRNDPAAKSGKPGGNKLIMRQQNNALKFIYVDIGQTLSRLQASSLQVL